MVRETSLSPEPHRPRASGTKERSCPLEPRPFHGDQKGFRTPLETYERPDSGWMPHHRIRPFKQKASEHTPKAIRDQMKISSILCDNCLKFLAQPLKLGKNNANLKMQTQKDHL
jgi:hypothetical protein